MKYSKSTERWGIFELSLTTVLTFENPFLDVTLQGVFRSGMTVKTMDGFYDGDGVWKIRYMPEEMGTYTFHTVSNQADFHGLTGAFEATAPAQDNHGPVRVQDTFHFAYADGTPFFVMGTTAYAWTYRTEEIRQQSLASFAQYGFNKIRMLVFPKYYIGGYNDVNISYEPPVHAFEGTPGQFDFTRPNPAFFRYYEDRVMDLMNRGIEADVILFHPYDKWNIDQGMDNEDDLLYTRYLVARLAAHRNVWWSLGNEYDISRTADGKFATNMERKAWDLLGAYIHAKDPFRHLLSSHNIAFGIIYPDRHWLTHVSYQHPDTYTLLLELKANYKKPVINDEYQYEGNIRDDWGNSTGELTVFRHWLTAMAGGYGTHGEVFRSDDNNRDLFWSYGGTLIGESGPRLRYLKEILLSCPWQQMERDYVNTDGQHYFSITRHQEEYLLFSRWDLPGKGYWLGPYDGSEPEYDAVVYDVWNCQVKERLVVKQGHPFPITAWTAIHLKRRE